MPIVMYLQLLTNTTPQPANMQEAIDRATADWPEFSMLDASFASLQCQRLRLGEDTSTEWQKRKVRRWYSRARHFSIFVFTRSPVTHAVGRWWMLTHMSRAP
jgi:hypothetical protein